MPSKAFNLAEAVSMAVNLEIKGRKFYQEAAKNSENPTAKQVFINLADEEMTHLRTFQAMLEKNSDLPKWREQARKSPRKPVIPVFDDKARASLRRATADELEALRIAMKQEKEAMEFFEKAGEQAEDDITGSIFLFIKEQEVYHYDLLQAEHDHITRTGFWFDTPEFRMDGKT
jgi:rubrerythrin